jgi:hypothetical protein
VILRPGKDGIRCEFGAVVGNRRAAAHWRGRAASSAAWPPAAGSTGSESSSGQLI